VLLCGLCFGLGYATGHRGASDAVQVPATASAQPPAPMESGRPKPSADAQTSAAPPNAASDQAAVALPSPAMADGSPPAEPQVKPAFASTVNPVQAGQLPAAAVTPAMGSLIVQIAAVSQQEDADVLMSALRRRGYAVAAHREPLDGLIHVRIGPFKTRDEADAWRQKLLNDGYNAIVQP